MSYHLCMYSSLVLDPPSPREKIWARHWSNFLVVQTNSIVILLHVMMLAILCPHSVGDKSQLELPFVKLYHGAHSLFSTQPYRNHTVM